MKVRHVLVAASAFLAAATLRAEPAEPAVSRIDHVLLEDDNPDAVFRLLSEKLRLPVVWPMAGHGSFSSGGVYFGNVVIEVGRFGFPGQAPRGALVGIALQPFTDAPASVLQLEERRIAHDAPAPFLVYLGGRPEALWTNVRIRGIAPPEAELFICQYHIDAAGRASVAGQTLASDRGGPLGLVGVKEVVVESSDRTAALQQWHSLLAPVSEHDGVFELRGGPSIHVIGGSTDALLSLTLEVSSLRKAARFLAESGLTGEGRDSEFVIGEPGGRALTVRLVEH